MPLVETWISGILGCGLGLDGGLITESCKFCKVFCASCLRLVGLLGLNTEWNCSFRAFVLSGSAVYVFSLAIRSIENVIFCESNAYTKCTLSTKVSILPNN